MKKIALTLFFIYFLINLALAPTLNNLPTSCQDSDGDCDVSRINSTDDIYEFVDLLTFPFGYLIADGFTNSIPEEDSIDSAYIHVLWFTDIDLGATDINIDYWDGSSWINCAGPFEENDTRSETICNVSHLTREQLSNLQVRIRGKDIDGFPMAFLYVDSIFVQVNYTIGIPYLEVRLIAPNPLFTNYVVQNSTFTVNATVYCRVGNCGDVYGTLLYNLTSLNPDTPINTSYGDVPFFIDENPPISMKSCPNNPLNEGMFCNLSWIVNVTGDLFTEWKIGVYFNSSFSFVRPNSTENATIYILPCPIDFTLNWDIIDFGELVPNTYGNPAIGNSLKIYNISVNPGSCSLDFYIRGDDLYNENTNSYITVGNISFSNSTNSYSNSFRLKKEYQHLFINLTQGEYTTYYWIDVPPIYAGTYISTIYIKGVYSGLSP